MPALPNTSQLTNTAMGTIQCWTEAEVILTLPPALAP
jgi:hypothetical protein